MWVIVPVKSFRNAKLRLDGVLSSEQRAKLSYLMVDDILLTLQSSTDVHGVAIISSDESVRSLAQGYKTEFLLTDADSGYSQDVMHAVTEVSQHVNETIAVIPSDVPQLSCDDLSQIELNHEQGITLCPAVTDGGTNGLIFSPPLKISLMFGIDSLKKYENAALENNIPLKIQSIAGLERDIDRPEDLLWLQNQNSGGKAWLYVRELDIKSI
jgi:2-phospho-L-lactate/phosphoenolpyruvate guanylyltransferase